MFSRVRDMLHSISEAVAIAFAFVVGAIFLAAAFVWHFVPKWRTDDEARRRSDAIQEALSEARRARATELQAKLDAIDAAASADRKEDSVAAANRFVLDHWGKK